MNWRAVDVERLIGEEHPARAIWTLVGRLDFSPAGGTASAGVAHFCAFRKSGAFSERFQLNL